MLVTLAALIPPSWVDIPTHWHWACRNHLLCLGSLHKAKQAIVPAFQFQKKTCLLGFKISIEIISVCQTFPQRKVSRRFPESRLWSLSTVRTTNTTPSYPTFELSSDAPACEAWISSFWSSSILLWLGCTLDSFILPNSTPNCCNLFPFPLCLFHSLARLLPPYQHNGYHYYPLILCLPELI